MVFNQNLLIFSQDYESININKCIQRGINSEWMKKKSNAILRNEEKKTLILQWPSDLQRYYFFFVCVYCIYTIHLNIITRLL